MLADKQTGKSSTAHVPFRDSNLTRLLKPNLGGNSNTAMIATVSLALSAVENTKSTLQFVELAEKVRSGSCSHYACSFALLPKTASTFLCH